MSTPKPVALITGGGRGIGFGISKSLAAAGYDLAICGVRDEASVTAPLDELRSDGARVMYCQADISQGTDRAKLIDAVRDAYGRLDVLVNNAGVAPTVRADILEATEESFDRLVKINLRGPYFLTQLAARWMVDQRKSDSGKALSIINVSSISAVVASTSRGDYCITKAGVSMSTQLWAARLGDFNIPVYEVQPGIIKTDMTSGVTDKYDKLIEEGLLVDSRWGTPEDVGTVVRALATGSMPYATGQVIRVDGGLTLRRL